MSAAAVILLGEVRKHLLIAWKYRANTLLRLFTGSFLLIGLYFLIGEGVISSVKNTAFFVAFLAWMYAVAPMGAMSYSLRSEMTEGTLEQMTMSPLPFSIVMAGRLFGALLVNTLEIIIMGFSTWLILRVNLTLTGETLVILLVIIVGVSGFAYLVAGGVLVFKEFESFINIFVNVLMLLNGTLYPVERMPAWLRTFALTSAQHARHRHPAQNDPGRPLVARRLAGWQPALVGGAFFDLPGGRGSDLSGMRAPRQETGQPGCVLRESQ